MASSYKKVSTGEIKGWVEEEILQLMPPHFFEDPVRVIQELNGKVIKESRLRWAAIFCLPNQQRIFLKRDRTKGWFESAQIPDSPFQGQKGMVHRPSITKAKSEPSRGPSDGWRDSIAVLCRRVITFQKLSVQGFR